MDFSRYECEGQMDIFDLLNKRNVLNITKPIRLIELFAGYGSQAMAFEHLGVPIEHHFVCEFDKYAVNSYNAVHGTDFETTDIRDIHNTDLNITDTKHFTYLLTYSFPCTDLSVAGKMAGMSKGSGTRSGLLWEVERLLQEIIDNNGELPQILFMENVKQVIGKGNMADFQLWLDFLESIGYVNTYKVLNAKNYGVAQNRERCFMFSFLKSEFGENLEYEFPKEIPLEKRLVDYLEEDVPESMYIKTEKAEILLKQLVENGTIANTILRAEQSRAEQSKIVTLGNLGVGGERGVVYGTDGISCCQSATQYKDPYKVMEIGYLDKGTGKHQSNVVYDPSGTAPCVTSSFGYKQPPTMITEVNICKDS